MPLNSAVTTWTAIIPVRSLTESKTRLQGVPEGTSALTAAFLIDAISACLATTRIGSVIVVTPDQDVASLAESHGARVHLEQAPAGINEAITQARADLDPESPIIAILGDTPCLSAEVLDQVLDAANSHAVSFVSDTAGTGSTMWCSHDRQEHSHFGHHSRAEHRNAGAVELGSGRTDPIWAKARRDVDTPVDLWDAVRLGVGPATASTVQGLI